MKHYIFISMFIFLFSCVDKKENIEIIHLDEAMDNVVSIDLNVLTDSIRYVPLETNDNCLISEIRKVELVDSLLFVRNKRDDLYVFNLNGDFLNTIGEPGKGPGEYIRLWDFFIDKTKNRVAIFDQPQAKIIEYSYDGEFLNEFRVKCCPDGVKKIKDSYHFSSAFLGVDTLIYEYKGNEVINNFTKKDLCLEEYTEHIPHAQSLSSFDDSVTYWTELNNYVFRIKDGKVLKRYFLDYGKYRYEVIKTDDVNVNYNARKGYGCVERFIETKNYIFINSAFKNYAKHILYDKKTKVASVVDNQICNRNTLFNNLSLVNTKDGLVNFWPDIDGKINDTMLYQTFYAYNFKESNFCDPEGEVQKSKNIQLQKIIDESSYTDNPVIMIITLKQ